MRIFSSFGWIRLKLKALRILSNPLCLFDGPRQWVFRRQLQIRLAIINKLPQKKSAWQYLSQQRANIDEDTCDEVRGMRWLTEGAPCQFHMIDERRYDQTQNKVLKFVPKQDRED